MSIDLLNISWYHRQPTSLHAIPMQLDTCNMENRPMVLIYKHAKSSPRFLVNVSQRVKVNVAIALKEITKGGPAPYISDY